MHSLRKYSSLLRRLKTASKKQRVQIIKYSPDHFINSLVQVALTSRRVPKIIPANKKLRSQIKSLLRARTTGRARQVLSQGGGILPVFLSALAPLIGKAALGIGASVAGAALGSVVKKAINKR